jgi:hypothetical protein
MKPLGRVPEILRPNDLNAEVHRRDAHPANRGRGDGAVVQAPTLHHEVREPRGAAHTAKLRPEGPLDDRGVEAANGLSFDNGAIRDFVVSCPQPHSGYIDAELVKKPQHPIGFSGIHDDSRHRRSIHRDLCRLSAERVSKRQQRALSRSESAW